MTTLQPVTLRSLRGPVTFIVVETISPFGKIWASGSAVVTVFVESSFMVLYYYKPMPFAPPFLAARVVTKCSLYYICLAGFERGWTMARAVGLRVATALSFFVHAFTSPAYAAGAPDDLRLPLPKEQFQYAKALLFGPKGQCLTAPIYTYDVRGFWMFENIRNCYGDFSEVNREPTREAGSMVFFVIGGAGRGSVYSVIKGKPNTEYTLDYSKEYLNSVSYQGRKGADFTTMQVGLPFVPYALTTYKDGYGNPFYAYGDLRIPPGMEAQAYPLTKKSIVVRVDGTSFDDPNSFMTMFSDEPFAHHYSLVEYVNSDSPTVVRSAFIPWVDIKNSPRWQALAKTSPLQDNKSSNSVLDWGVVVLFFAGAAALAQSPIGDYFRQEHDACVRRQQGNSGIVC